jgi:hypothetical protein
MLYTGFKSHFYIDQSGRLGFRIYREKASRISIKSKNTKNRVEQEIFGVVGNDNMFRISGSGTELRRLILTCKDFVEKYRYKIPKGATTLIFSKSSIIGPIEIEEGEMKIIDCSIYWAVENKPYVKHIPFAWLFSNSNYLNKVDPFIHSESDFYSSLFGRLYEIITQGYKEPMNENTKLKVLQVYMKLIERIEEEFKKELATTHADEVVFQQLLKRYKFFMCPEAVLIVSQPVLHGKVIKKPDFYIQVGEKEHIYVEIEPPFYKPFEGSTYSSRLKEALKQIAEWKKILIQQAPPGESIHYMIIIGRLDDLNKEEMEALQAFNKAQEDLAVVTWDRILKNVDKIKHEMINKLS